MTYSTEPSVFVRYNRNIVKDLCSKVAKWNQDVNFVRYSRVFVVTVIVISEFDCIYFKIFNLPTY